ncbi:sugar transporter [Vibrio parahaemolyticus]|uniref:sugar transporter n=1 Tax=Vibrio parahaemolyticus TaxID=670 RepID=UPI0023617263|nr:sugar transporter [Vibrio parahaemolyticus]
MSNWSQSVSEMDSALFDAFGESAVIAGQSAEVVPTTSQDQFGMMAANVTRLSISGSSGVKVRKGDKVTYKSRGYVVADVPEYHDGLISFDLK